MRINHNIAALNTYRQLSSNSANSSKSLEKLSSGLRINRAGDDAAGLAISEKMRGQIRGLDQASRNAQDGISMLQTAEGALNETHSILQRVRELTVQSNNGTNTDDDLAEIQKEISQLSSEVTRIGSKTEFNGKTLLTGSLGVSAASSGGASDAEYAAAGITFDASGVDTGETLTITTDAGADTITVTGTTSGVAQTISQDPEDIAAGSTLSFDAIGLSISFSADADLETLDGGATASGSTLLTSGTSVAFQIGANSSTTLTVSIEDMRATNLGSSAANGNVASLDAVNVTTKDFSDNLEVIDAAIKDVSGQRSQLGAYTNRLEHTINNLGTSSENLTAAESRIRDVDMAAEMMQFTKNNILSQAAQSMLAQANQQPQGVLQLLR